MDNEGKITPESVAYQRALDYVANLRVENLGKAFPVMYDAIRSVQSRFKEYRMAQQELDSLTGSQSEKEKQNARVVAMVQMGIDRDIAIRHMDFVNNGFGSKSDFYRYGDMLNDDNYWDYLKNNDEEREGVADRMATDVAQMVKDGEMTVEEIGQARRENARLGQLLEEGDLKGKLDRVGVENSTGIGGVHDVVAGVTGDNKLDMLKKKNREVIEEASISNGELTGNLNRAEEGRDTQRFEVEGDLLTKAANEKIKTKYDDSKEQDFDMFAGILDANPGAQIGKELQYYNATANNEYTATPPKEVSTVECDLSQSKGSDGARIG